MSTDLTAPADDRVVHDLLPVATARRTSRASAAMIASRPWWAALTFAAYLVGAACGLIAPWALGRVVDSIGSADASSTLAWACTAICAAVAAGSVLTAISVVGTARTAEPPLARLREEALDRALAQPAGRLERAGAGDVLSRLGEDVAEVGASLGTVVPLMLEAVLAVVLTAVGLFALDWRLGLAGLVAFPAYALSLRWYLPRSAPLYRQERRLVGERAEALVGALQGAATVRAHGSSAAQVSRVARASEASVDLSLTLFWLFGRFWGRNNRAELIGVLAIVVVGFLVVDAGAVELGAVTTAALLFLRLFNPVGTIVGLFDDAQAVGASLTRVVGVAEMPLPPAPDAVGARGDEIRLSGIRFTYGEGLPEVLHGVDLVVQPGERVAVVGSTGSGKSTLAALAAGVLVPTAGAVTLGGVPLAALGEERLRTMVCLVTQEVHVFGGTVADNLRLARTDATDDELRAALGRVGATWVETLPDGLATDLGETRTLTSSQSQHLALARVELLDPRVVVLDEATAEAGTAGARELDAAAQAVVSRRGALVVAHRLSQAVRCDRIVVLEHGVVVEEGPHGDLVAAGGRYSELWQAWSGGAPR